MTRVLVTGASGFLGRHVLAALADSDLEVHALARRLGPDLPPATWHEADLLASAHVVAEIAPEILVHLAWYAEHGRFWTSEENLRWVGASLELLRAFAEAGGRRAVLAGTCAEYEWSLERYSEDSPVKPATLYGTAKHALHLVCAAFAEQRRMELAWGRLFFLYGPFEAPSRFVPSIVIPLLRGEAAPMSAGTQRRDLLHIADAGRAFAALAQSPLTGAVNIASGEAPALRDVAAQIAERVGRPELLHVGARETPAGDPPALAADVRRLRDELGFRPAIALGDGLEQVIAWWRERLAREPPDG